MISTILSAIAAHTGTEMVLCHGLSSIGKACAASTRLCFQFVHNDGFAVIRRAAQTQLSSENVGQYYGFCISAITSQTRKNIDILRKVLESGKNAQTELLNRYDHDIGGCSSILFR